MSVRGQKLLVISMDALLYEDLEYLSTQPSFRWMLENGAQVQRVRSIYPTLTYPCHATMATGCFPASHGVVNNTAFAPGTVSSPWNWFHDVYKVRDLFDAAKEKGLSTACVGWPSMGNHPHVDYLVGEIAATKATTVAEFHRDYTLTGTPQELWETVCLPHIHWRTERKRVAPFNAMVCGEIIRRYAPDLTMIHLANPDAARHQNGVFSEKNLPALDECEMILTELRNAVRDSGAEERYNIVVTADHGQLDTDRNVNPNVLFAENGFLTVDETGTVTDWRAWSHSVGMCATVYVKDPADEGAVYDLLNRHLGAGYEKIFTREEAAAQGYSGGFAFVLETDGHTGFGNAFRGDYTVPPKKPGGSHGFHPDKGPRPTILGVGPAFRKGAVLPGANLTDGAPTWAKILGLELPDADGKALNELLNV